MNIFAEGHLQYQANSVSGTIPSRGTPFESLGAWWQAYTLVTSKAIIADVIIADVIIADVIIC